MSIKFISIKGQLEAISKIAPFYYSINYRQFVDKYNGLDDSEITAQLFFHNHYRNFGLEYKQSELREIYLNTYKSQSVNAFDLHPEAMSKVIITRMLLERKEFVEFLGSLNHD